MVRVFNLGHTASAGEVIRTGWPQPLDPGSDRRTVAQLRQYVRAGAGPTAAGKFALRVADLRGPGGTLRIRPA